MLSDSRLCREVGEYVIARKGINENANISRCDSCTRAKEQIVKHMANINPNQESSQSQCNAILAYLQNGNAITGIEALRLFGCFRLPSRIHDLKQRGVRFTKKFITTDNGKRVMQYSLAQN